MPRTDTAARFFSVALVAASACGDVIPKEGRYECAADDECPSGWSCNTSGDGLCYRDPSHFPATSETDSATHHNTDSLLFDTSSETDSSVATGNETSSETFTSSGTSTTDTSSVTVATDSTDSDDTSSVSSTVTETVSATDSGSANDSDSATSDTASDTGDACQFTGVLFNFDAGDDGFTHGSTIDSGPDPWSLGDWLGSCASGSACFVTAPGTTYAPCTSAELVSPIIDLSGCGSSTLVLSFSHAYSLEPLRGGKYRDGALVQVSGDGGATWQDISPTPAYAGTLEGDYTKLCNNVAAQADGHEAWSGGASSGWVEVTAEIPSTAITASFRLRFLFGSDRVGELLGWAVDDVSISML